jgi:hypothetical protein
MNMLEDSHCNFFIWKKYLETVHFWTSKNNSCYTWIYWISKYLNYNLGKYPWRLEPSIFWKSTTVKIFFSHFFLSSLVYLQCGPGHIYNFEQLVVMLTMIIHWPCCCTVHVYVVVQFCNRMWSFWMEESLLVELMNIAV